MSARADQAAGLRDEAPIARIDGARRRVIAVTGGKGGVGKSTVALNLAIACARRGGRTLALDGDLGMADLNLLLGLAPERSLLDVLEGAPVEEILVEAHGIHLLPALNGSARLADLDDLDRRLLLGAVERLRDRFDTLVIDTGAGIGGNAIGFAAAAADVVVVATAEPLSLADAYACLKVLSQRGVTRAFVLPNAARSPSQADEIVARLSALVTRFLPLELVPLPPVPWDPQVAESAAAGVPVVANCPESPASRALRKAVQRLDALARPADERDVMGGWLQGAIGGGA